MKKESVRVIIAYSEITNKYEVLEYINNHTFRYLKSYKTKKGCISFICKNHYILLEFDITLRR